MTAEAPTTSRRRLSSAARWTAVGLAAGLVLVVDQLSKRWALDRLYPNDVIELVGSLQFRLRFNTGMAFSGFSNSGAIIGVVAILIAVVLVVIARKVTSVFQLMLIGIMIGGALGNVIDRASRVGEVKDNNGTVAEGFMSGAVVDFIDLQWWPIFNVADAAIVVGGIALALTGLRTPESDEDEHGADETVDLTRDASGTEVG
jgi:signal peptidase II